MTKLWTLLDAARGLFAENQIAYLFFYGRCRQKLAVVGSNFSIRFWAYFSGVGDCRGAVVGLCRDVSVSDGFVWVLSGVLDIKN